MTNTQQHPVRWGILGASKFARYQMAPAIQLAENAVFAGLATSSPEKARSLTALAPGVTLYDSYDALLQSPDIDAVYIPLPNHLHVEWTIKALEAGKPVLTEKPIERSASAAAAIVETCDRADVPLGVVVQHRLRPASIVVSSLHALLRRYFQRHPPSPLQAHSNRPAVKPQNPPTLSSRQTRQ